MTPAGEAAILTGGASGLGEATARALAAAGTKVALLHVDAERSASLAERIGGFALACDVASADTTLHRSLVPTRFTNL